MAKTSTKPGAPATERASRARSGETLDQCVRRSLEQYFSDLDGARPHALHGMVINAVERPLLQFAMERSRRQPVGGRRTARHQPQHAAEEAAGIPPRLKRQQGSGSW